MSNASISTEKTNGPVAAALLAGGIGAAVLALMTILAEASSGIRTALNWFAPVGPLSGKTGIAVLAFAVSWIVLYVIFRGKNVDFKLISLIALILLTIGLLGTFPPLFLLFAAK